ncbi:MAG: hypothetical protein IJ204_02525 [Paludibacteraceae bacterium]|nr:hypothetical protein [Paludibacteraceae bacterium]
MTECLFERQYRRFEVVCTSRHSIADCRFTVGSPSGLAAKEQMNSMPRTDGIRFSITTPAL